MTAKREMHEYRLTIAYAAACENRFRSIEQIICFLPHRRHMSRAKDVRNRRIR